MKKEDTIIVETSRQDTAHGMRKGKLLKKSKLLAMIEVRGNKVIVCM